jgi:hypothetical protein
VDRDRQTSLAGRLPHVVEAPIVGEDELAPVVPDVQAEVFPDLEPLRPGRDRASQRVDEPPVEPRPIRLAPVELTERREASRMRPVVAVEVGFELVLPSAVEIHHGGDVHLHERREELVHVGDDPAAVATQPLPEVVVRIDRGNARSIDRMVLGPQHGPWAEGAKRQIRERPLHR